MGHESPFAKSVEPRVRDSAGQFTSVPKTLVVRFGAMKLVGEFPYGGG